MSTFSVNGSIEEMLPSLEPVLHRLPKKIMVQRFHPEPLKFILQRFSPTIALIDTLPCQSGIEWTNPRNASQLRVFSTKEVLIPDVARSALQKSVHIQVVR